MSLEEKLIVVAENQQRVYEAGKQAGGGIDWRVFQDYGKRNNYEYAFVRYWEDSFYHPLYTIAGSMRQAFYNSHIQDVQMPIVATGAFYGVFQGSEVVTIPSLDLTAVSSITNAFQNAAQLTNLTFTGVIKVNGLNLASCEKLTRESLLSMIDCLDDKKADTSGTSWIVTIGSINKAKLTAAELSRATAKGWTVV